MAIILTNQKLDPISRKIQVCNVNSKIFEYSRSIEYRSYKSFKTLLTPKLNLVMHCPGLSNTSLKVTFLVILLLNNVS